RATGPSGNISPSATTLKSMRASRLLSVGWESPSDRRAMSNTNSVRASAQPGLTVLRSGDAGAGREGPLALEDPRRGRVADLAQLGAEAGDLLRSVRTVEAEQGDAEDDLALGVEDRRAEIVQE